MLLVEYLTFENERVYEAPSRARSLALRCKLDIAMAATLDSHHI